MTVEKQQHCPSPTTQVKSYSGLSWSLVSYEFYKSYMHQLPKDLLAFMDKEPKGDKSYLLYQNTQVVGGFRTSKDGYMGGFFTLIEGIGKEAFKLRLEVSEQDMENFGILRFDCIGIKMRDIAMYNGFQVMQTMQWDTRYAPDNWNGTKFGYPNIYFMERT